jgi:hypothetical protein
VLSRYHFYGQIDLGAPHALLKEQRDAFDQGDSRAGGGSRLGSSQWVFSWLLRRSAADSKSRVKPRLRLEGHPREPEGVEVGDRPQPTALQGAGSGLP